MPFQSEKQRRFLHANHPEIAKRWEKEYANGGISNHFRRKFFTGALADTQQGQAMSPGTSASGGLRHTPSGNGGGGGPKPHSGPTFAEIQAQKKAAAAAAAAEKKAIADAQYQEWITRKDKKKKKVKHFKKLNPVKINSKFTEDTKQTNGESKTFIKNKFSIEDLITGNINRHTDLVTPNLGTISTFMHPEGIQVQTGGDMGPIEHFPLSGPQSWAVNPGKPQDDDFSDIQGHQAGLTKKQKQALKGSQKNLKNIMGISNEEILENIKMWDDPDDPATVKDIETFYSAKGGVARKNYFHGGILDINASEEIISDDGNDIELTDYNAAFDDPKDLSTGVKTLFQAKDGGRIGYAEGWSPGVAAEEKAQERASRGPRDDPDRFGPVQTVSQPTGDGYQDRIIEVQERTRKQDLKDLVATGPGSDEEKYDTDLVGMSDAEKYSARRNMIKSKYTGKSDPRVQSLKSNYQTEKARLEKKLNKSLFLKGLMLFMGMPVGITDFVSVDWKNKSLKGPLKTAMTLDQLKKQHIEDLTSIKESFLAGVDINNPNEMANLDNTVFPDIMKELTDLTKPRDKDEDTKGDGGPELPPQLGGPSTEEMAREYDWLGGIRAKQALREQINPDWQLTAEAKELKNNPIVGGTERNIIAIGNSGGLANLFRVKNQ